MEDLDLSFLDANQDALNNKLTKRLTNKLQGGLGSFSGKGLGSITSGIGNISKAFTGMNKTVTETHDIKVNIPDIPFAYDMSYVVGDHNYYSGVSTPSTTGSWDKANQAKAINESVQTPHDTLLFERRAIVKFNQGDIWKIRTASEYLETDGYKDGLSYLVGVLNIVFGIHPLSWSNYITRMIQ